MPELSCGILRNIIELWPSQNSKQAIILLNGIEDILEISPPTTVTYIYTYISIYHKDIKKVFLDLMCRQCIVSENFTIVQRAILLLNNPIVFSLVVNDIDTLVPALLHSYHSQFSETTKKMCYNLLVMLDKSQNFFSKYPALLHLKQIHDERDLRDKHAEEEKHKQMAKKKTGLCYLDFGLGRILGKGSYATVRHALRIDPSVEQRYWEEYAIKIMDKALLEEQKHDPLIELEITQTLQHTNMIQCISFFEDEKRLFLVLEYAGNGDVHALLEKLGSVDVKWARYVVGSVVSALEYIHSQGYVHLDVKPEVNNVSLVFA